MSYHPSISLHLLFKQYSILQPPTYSLQYLREFLSRSYEQKWRDNLYFQLRILIEPWKEITLICGILEKLCLFIEGKFHESIIEGKLWVIPTQKSGRKYHMSSIALY